MPRWVSLLALMLCALLGGAAEVWAEAAAGPPVHETAPPVEAEVEVEEEATHADEARAPGALAAAASATGTATPPDAEAGPRVPPPR